MTESVWFEADGDKAVELGRLASRLGASREDLLNEALDLLLAVHRAESGPGEPVGALACLHELTARLRRMIDELRFIRMTTCGVASMLSELGVEDRAFEVVSRHYDAIHQSSERALAAAGLGPMLVTVSKADAGAEGPRTDSLPAKPKLKRYWNE